MAFDFNLPVTTSNHATVFVPTITAGWLALGVGLDPSYAGTLTNIPTGAKRWNAGAVQEWNGSSWVAYTLKYIPNTNTPTRGSHEIVATNGGWAGFTFPNSTGDLELIFGTSLTRVSGVFAPAVGWDWRWENGVLVDGTVPYTRLSGTPDLSVYAPKVSPALTGTPTVPTAAADTTTTQAASTAFVIGQAASSAPLMNGTAAVGTSKKYARGDHVHASDTSRAPTANPNFTGTATYNGLEIGLRRVPVQIDSVAYTLVASDVAKCVLRDGNVTVPAGVFVAGDVVAVHNNSTAATTLIQASGTSLLLAGTTLSGNRTMGPRAMVSLYCIASNVFLVSGAGVS